eukprot:3577869-Amphidinium_carterae.1
MPQGLAWHGCAGGLPHPGLGRGRSVGPLAGGPRCSSLASNLNFAEAMKRVRMLNLPLRFKMRMIRALYPLVIYGSEVSGLAATSLLRVRVSARRALGR